jgi:hypothetical protein
MMRHLNVFMTKRGGSGPKVLSPFRAFKCLTLLIKYRAKYIIFFLQMGKATGFVNTLPSFRKRMAEMRLKGYNKAYFAQALGCSERTVQRNSVNHDFSDKNRSGRPQKLSQLCKAFITNNKKINWEHALAHVRINLTVASATVKKNAKFQDQLFDDLL